MPNESGRRVVPPTKKHIARLERERQQGKIILYMFFGILVAVVLLLGYGFLDIKYLQLRKPVARVGNAEILAGPFEARVRLYRQQLLGQYSQYLQYQQIFGMDVTSQLQQITTPLNDPVTIGQNVLDQMIDDELVRQEAAKRGIVVTDAELESYIQNSLRYFPNGTPTPTITPTDIVMPEIPAEAFNIVTMTPTITATPLVTSTPEATSTPLPVTITGTVETPLTQESTATATATLEPTATITPTLEILETPPATSTPLPTATPMTLEGYQKEYSDLLSSLARFGVTEKDYRSLFELQLLREKLREAITADVPTTEEQVWARHILVADEATAKDVIARLKSGEDFATLAIQLSQDTGSAANGGDLGWFGKGAMVPEFEQAAFALKNPGDISDPVQSQFGYHIIQLIAKQDRPLSADQVNQAKDKAFSDWLTKARDEYGVETFDFWKERVPTEPNFESSATEGAKTAAAYATGTAKAEDEITPTAAP